MSIKPVFKNISDIPLYEQYPTGKCKSSAGQGQNSHFKVDWSSPSTRETEQRVRRAEKVASRGSGPIEAVQGVSLARNDFTRRILGFTG